MIAIYKEFKKFVSENYDMKKRKIAFKYYHTLRVVDVAKQIGKSINLNEEDLYLAETCAILHDIARFKQATEYDTFEDSLSFDHGDMGEKILRKNDYINNYLSNPLDKELIIKTVRNHNKYMLENGLNEKERLFCNIVRDADKVDILIHQGNKPFDSTCTINNKILEAFNNHTLVNNKYVSNYLENILREIAMIFDLNFKKSYEIVKKEKVIDRLFNNIRKYNSSDILDELYSVINKYVENKIK